MYNHGPIGYVAFELDLCSRVSLYQDVSAMQAFRSVMLKSSLKATPLINGVCGSKLLSMFQFVDFLKMAVIKKLL